jgi:ribosomal protein L37AE/L43A
MNNVIHANFIRKQREEKMEPIIYICDDCNWDGAGESYTGICPNCHSVDVKNLVNPNWKRDERKDDEHKSMRYM